MKTVITLFTFLICLSGTSQTMLDQMGGVECNFQFYSDATHQLDVIKQVLIERATAKTDVSTVENESYGYGYAYTDWRIEFVSKNIIPTKEREGFEERAHRGYYKLTLKNQAGGVLLSQFIHKKNVTEWAGNNGSMAIYTYSINLAGLPVVILDNVSIIEIVLID